MGSTKDAGVKSDGQPYMLDAIGETARIMGDPDWKIITEGRRNFTTGVRNGAASKLRSTPAVFQRKRRWKRYELGEENYNMGNYKTADASSIALLEQFKGEETLQRVSLSTLA